MYNITDARLYKTDVNNSEEQLTYEVNGIVVHKFVSKII